MSIEQLFPANLGLWVEYITSDGEKKIGRVRSFSNTQQRAWVVMGKDVESWEDTQEYIDQACDYDKLEPLTNEY